MTSKPSTDCPPQDKRTLLAQLLRKKEAAPKSYPLSFAQQRMWVLSQFDPQSPAYNIPAAVRSREAINVAALEQALNEIIKRHDVLRTIFSTIDGQPVQIVISELRLKLPVVSLRHLPAPDREAEAMRYAVDDARCPFDLARGPLVRASLLQLDERDYMLLLNMHHIIADGWSLNVLIREVRELYHATIAGQPSQLQPLPIQYADYAIWQRQWLQGDILAAQLAYWKRQLGDAPHVLPLPTDRPRPLAQTFRGACRSLRLPARLTDDLRVLSRRAGVTLFMTLLAAFKTLLYRYTGQDDIVVGTPIANRSRIEVEDLIGFFMNTLVLRTDLSGNPTFQELLKRVRKIALGAYAHQDIPFERLVNELRPDRNTSHTPLFQVMFTLESQAAQVLAHDEDTADTLIEVDNGTTKFDIILSLRDGEQALTAVCQYNTDLFNDDTIERLLMHYWTLLEGIVADPGQTIARLPLLTEAERQKILVDWNRTDLDFASDRLLHQDFEAQAACAPHMDAIVFGHARLSYRELERRSNQLAHNLRSHGVGPDVLVGIFADRSIEMIVGMLGVLKAGGAYVPIDPLFPTERLAFILADIQAPLLLSQQHLLSRLPRYSGRVLCLESEWATAAGQPGADTVPPTMPNHLAYVIYTSGSTGIPKGVAITHRSAVALITWARSVFPVEQLRGVLASTSFCFDVSIFEVFTPLSSGGTLILAEHALQLPQLPEVERVRLLTGVPSVIMRLLSEGDLPPGITTVNLGGEALTQGLVEQLRRQPTVRQIYNLYGPTETTVYSAFALMPPGSDDAPFIGRPVSNTQIYILDRNLQPVPIGVPGELHISGVGLARGYLNRPDLTAERFIPNPFTKEKGKRKKEKEFEQADEALLPSSFCLLSSGERLYRTGDLVRYRPDGAIEYLGRLDHQVKIRGFRIELEEIDAALQQHFAVRQAVVVVREDQLGNKQLVAYVVPEIEDRGLKIEDSQARDSETLSSTLHPLSSIQTELRDFLRQKLPEYMVPAVFVLLDALPLKAQGKVDRQALPLPDRAHAAQPEMYVEPRTPVEQLLATIWANVLGLDRIGIYDNFFENGGDSIVSIQIISRANQAGLRLSPKQLFRYPTIASLAAMTDATPAIRAEQSAITGAVPLTPIQSWFFEQNFVEMRSFTQSAVLELLGGASRQQLEQAIQALLIHHDALRMRFERTETGWLQINAGPQATVYLHSVDLTSLLEREQAAAMEAVAAEQHASIRLTEAPLVRAILFDLGSTRPNRLLLIVHHLVIDAVSWRVLFEDLHTACRQLSQGKPIALPAKTTSFKYWSERLGAYARSRELQQELAYWLAAPHAAVRPLPTDDVAPTEQADHSIVVMLDIEQTQALLHEAPKAYNTQINDMLLAALALVFGQWTGSHALLVDLEGHGREDLLEDVDLSRTVGWFTTLFPVLLDLREGAALGDALTAVKEQLRTIPNRGIGYGLLRYLSPDAVTAERLRSLPQAEVSFNYLGQFNQKLADDDVFALLIDSVRQTQSQHGQGSYLITINGYVADGRLTLSWLYRTNRYRRSTIERLAADYMATLCMLIAHCRSPESGRHTPSDFPLARLDQQKLGKLASLLEQIDG